MKLVTPVILVCFGVLYMSCNDSRRKSIDNETDVVYEASVIRKSDITGQLVLPGELEGYYETDITAKVSGYIKKILVDIGDRVSQDQLLVELEAPELMSQMESVYADLQAKEAIYTNTKGKYTRLKQTNKTKGAVSPYDMDFAETSIVSDSLAFVGARSKYESVKSLTDYLKIRAPFDGIVTERALAPGAFVGPNEKNPVPILKLKSEGRLRLHVAVPEIHLAEVKTGRLVQFSVKSFPNKLFQGMITRLSKNLSKQTRSEIIEIEIENKSGDLLPGMYANTIIPLRRTEPSLVVPQSAVVTNMERNFVIKINENKAHWVDVEKGELQGEKVEIFGTLVPGDTVLNTASDEIKDNQYVKTVVVKN